MQRWPLSGQCGGSGEVVKCDLLSYIDQRKETLPYKIVIDDKLVSCDLVLGMNETRYYFEGKQFPFGCP